ncbi:MAG: metal-dependent hydrolase [Halobacteria archaeon]|nr:metal-dependent hydrolase [Halobacteria archaeon]
MSGHSLLAFSVVSLVAVYKGYPKDRALLLGVFAGIFALLPDVDMFYALVGVGQSNFGGIWDITHSFWQGSTVTHRGVTHSLVVGSLAGVAFSWFHKRSAYRVLGVITLILLTVVSFVVTGLIEAAVMSIFSLAGIATVFVASRYDLTYREVLVVSLFGLVSHPFGDVFTGEPPMFLYPFDYNILETRVTLLPEPTLNLISIFMLEITLIWVAILVFTHLMEMRVVSYVNPRAALGALYAISVFVLPAPTLDMSYHFVFSVLAMGFVGVTSFPSSYKFPRRSIRGLSTVRIPRLRFPQLYHRINIDNSLVAVVTGLTAITLATVAYTAVYVVYLVV